jgi:hypothetical protein
MTSEPAVRLEHSVDVDVSPTFAWTFRTDVTTWRDPPATFELNGPFVAGSPGQTLMPGQEPLQWRIGEVRPGRSFVLEMTLDRAMLSFEWRFDPLSDGMTRMTQSIVLSGDNAAAYAPQVEAGFGSTLVDGMRRIAADMAAAERRTHQGS